MKYTCVRRFHSILRKLSWFQNIIVCLFNNSKLSPLLYISVPLDIKSRLLSWLSSSGNWIARDREISKISWRTDEQAGVMSVKQNYAQSYLHWRLLETIQRPSLEALAHQNCHSALSTCMAHCWAFGERNTQLSEVQTRQSIAHSQGKRMKGQTIYNRLMFLLLNSLVTAAQLCSKHSARALVRQNRNCGQLPPAQTTLLAL